jgi:hypothetical protein
LQKRLLDDVVVDQGKFTTDSLQGLTSQTDGTRWTAGEVYSVLTGASEPNAKLDSSVCSGLKGPSDFESILFQVEDQDDVDLAKQASAELRETEHAMVSDFMGRNTGLGACNVASVFLKGTGVAAACASAGSHSSDTAEGWFGRLPAIVQWGSNHILARSVFLQDLCLARRPRRQATRGVARAS